MHSGDALGALGLRQRESRRVYSVDVEAGTTGASLRALLLNAGIDAADIQKRLNAGETVHIAPVTIGLPFLCRSTNGRRAFLTPRFPARRCSTRSSAVGSRRCCTTVFRR
jgi:hypothetical protein